MMKILNILLLLFLLCGDGDVRYKIISLSSDTIRIGAENKGKGDIFSSNETIHWDGDSQVMRVMDVETEEMFILSGKVEQFAKEHTKTDYKGIVNSLSTSGFDMEESVEKRGYFFFTYKSEDESGTRTVRIEPGMCLHDYPLDLILYYYNPETSKNELKTNDFRGFVDDLIITDNMVKRHISGVDYYEGEFDMMKRDYMTMMRAYVDGAYRGIDYTYEELVMFKSLKY